MAQNNGDSNCNFSASAERVRKQEDEGVRGRRRAKGGETVHQDGLKIGNGVVRDVYAAGFFWSSNSESRASLFIRCMSFRITGTNAHFDALSDGMRFLTSL